jgi:heme-degrading monooxygenase HmoA
MFASIFEVLPARGKKDGYLELAKYLKPMLEAIDGFIDTERFESRRRPGWIVSYQIWRDEKSIVRWRIQGEHHATKKSLPAH